MKSENRPSCGARRSGWSGTGGVPPARPGRRDPGWASAWTGRAAGLRSGTETPGRTPGEKKEEGFQERKEFSEKFSDDLDLQALAAGAGILPERFQGRGMSSASKVCREHAHADATCSLCQSSAFRTERRAFRGHIRPFYRTSCESRD